MYIFNSPPIPLIDTPHYSVDKSHMVGEEEGKGRGTWGSGEINPRFVSRNINNTRETQSTLTSIIRKPLKYRGSFHLMPMGFEDSIYNKILCPPKLSGDVYFASRTSGVFVAEDIRSVDGSHWKGWGLILLIRKFRLSLFHFFHFLLLWFSSAGMEKNILRCPYF